MVLSKLVYDVIEQVNSFSDDSELDERYIMYLYGIKRSKYLRQDLNNFNRSYDNSIQQTLCLDMEEVSMNSCGLDLDCDKIMRSKQPLPKPLELHTKPAIVNIKPTNRISLPFNFITKERMYYMEGSLFPNNIYCFIDTDNYIYLYSLNEGYKLIECLTVTGVFEDPLELKNYKDCCGCEKPTECFDEMTSDYPLQPHYIDLIRNEIVQAIIGKLNIPEDKINDSID